MTLRDHLAGEFRDSLERCREERAACLHESDMDAVHDTRVASRRVLETIRMFEHLLRPNAVEPVRKALRGWMQRSSKVRDMDIAMDLVRDSGVAHCEDLIIAMQERREALVQKALRYLGKPVPWPSKREIGRWWNEPKRSDPEGLWDLDSGSADNGTMVIPWLLHRYALKGNRLLEGQPEDQEFHLFRLRTKRFRYSAEWFAPLLTEPALLPDFGAKALVSELKGFQQSLGAFQDAVAASQLLQEGKFKQHLDEGKSAALAAYLERRGKEAKQQFLTRWRDFRDEYAGSGPRELVWMSKAKAPYEDEVVVQSEKARAMGATG